VVGGAGAHGCVLCFRGVAAAPFRAALQRAVAAGLCVLWRQAWQAVRGARRVFSTADFAC